MAQDGNEDPLRGVWQGTIGTMPVTACFNGNDDRGVYYYDRHKKLIRLSNEDGFLFESIGYDDPSGDRWRLIALEGETLRAEWQGGDNRLPISLTRKDWSTYDEYDGPCESNAFMAPRLAGGRISEEHESLNGHGYTILRYTPPAHISSDNLQVITFAIDPTRLEDGRINYLLAYDLPRASVEDEVGRCFAWSTSSHGVDGDWHRTTSPEFLTERWLGVMVDNNLYCGGAHPSYWSERRVFDRQYGREVEPADWLNDRALVREQLSDGPDASLYATVGEEFLALLIAKWPKPEGNEVGELDFYNECIGVLESNAYWDFGLAPDGSGMGFIPGMPHFASSCSDTVTLSWDELTPFLSREGEVVKVTLTARD